MLRVPIFVVASIVLVLPSVDAVMLSILSTFTDSMILAPLTRAGNLPFRRLCCDFGCKVSMGEMVYARHLLQGDPVEKARLRRAPNEGTFGVQIATNNVEEGVAAMKIAKEEGADFVDINCGCPIFEATRRGLGSALLRNPKRLGGLVDGLVNSGVDIPVTVKIRLGTDDKNINVLDVAEEIVGAGAAALTIHGRSAQQRYSSAADWGKIKEVVETVAGSGTLVVGNGDIVSYGDKRRRIDETGVDAVMVGRGAMEKPWIFDNTGWEPDLKERVEVYRRLAWYSKEHFGDDDKGKRKAFFFLPFHWEFFCRYHPDKTDMQGRRDTGSIDDMDPLYRLMSCRDTRAHKIISDLLWDSGGDAEAVAMLSRYAEGADFAAIWNGERGDNDEQEVEELSNFPNEEKKIRKRRTVKPKRSPEDIEQVRAERKAKRERLGITDFKHVSGKRRGS
mmetsp:Transcript_20251/g.42432  ORF Transcript_20251/g.42432 Transcript_20251/m.42432 type:complete len:448 (-) Transcript_20251:24-1367(-)